MKYVETGFDVPTLTDLVSSAKSGDQIHSIGLNRTKMEEASEALQSLPRTAQVVFQLQDPRLILSRLTWADRVYLNSDLNLQDTVEEFRAAASTGAAVIEIKNYQHKAALAVEEAEKNGWAVTYEGDKAILHR